MAIERVGEGARRGLLKKRNAAQRAAIKNAAKASKRNTDKI
ncbi:MAG TPA: hypothetical protein VJH37_04735 [Candidatus Nanoarchaeia archaeon]|nr:hypothetical protein [Candidatus Nanoarchaeia archaeon]